MDALPKLRLSRPTNHLEAVIAFYVDGLGFDVLDRFDSSLLAIPASVVYLHLVQMYGC